MIRLFIGLELPEELKHMLADVSASLKHRVDGAKWVSPGNIHLTLKFLGPTQDEKVENIAVALSDVAANFRKFYFSLGDLGAFPSTRKARVVWVGVHHGSHELVALAQAIEDTLANLSFEPESRAFSPHITLARIKQPKSIQDAFSSIDADVCAGRIVNVDKITLFKSDLHSTGARYTALHRISLSP